VEREENGVAGWGGGVSQETAGDKTFLFPEEFNIKIREHRAFEGSL
jgi:hypothetical protein